jgi:hypothetical protein
MRLLVAGLILSVVILLGFAAFEARVLVPEPSNGPAQGVVWRGRTFATRADFARWLRSRGVSYRAWARSHPVQAGLVGNGSQKHSGRRPWLLARVAAFLAALALGLAFVRRRWPGSEAAAAHLFEVGVLRGAAAAVTGARTTRRWAISTARRSAALATTATYRSRDWLGRSAAHLLEVVALKGAAAAIAGARTTRRWAIPRARGSAALPKAASNRARHGLGGSTAHRLEVVALRRAAAAKAGVQTTRRWVALTAQRSAVLASAPTFGARWRRYELVWYVTTAVVAVGIGVVVAAWLNGG